METHMKNKKTVFRHTKAEVSEFFEILDQGCFQNSSEVHTHTVNSDVIMTECD